MFIGTGNGYAQPVSPLSDSLLALDYRTGEYAWHMQYTPGDAFRKGVPDTGPDADVVVTAGEGMFATQCRTGTDGGFDASLPEGQFDLLVHAEGRADVAYGPVDVSWRQTTEVDAELGAQGLLEFRAVDEEGLPSPVRGSFSLEGGGTSYKASHDGGDTVALLPGT